MANYAHTKSRIWQWTGIILILCLFGGAYWYFQVRASTLNQSQNDLNTNGLVGLWSFNGDDISGTTAYDRSGQGNNGTLTNGPSKTDGKIGQALDFFPNGSDTNAYVTMGDPGSGVLDFGTGDFSVSFWFKGRGFVSQGSSLNGMIMKRAVDSVNAAGWVFYTDSNNGVGLNVNGGSDSSSIYITGGTGKATDNTWHHVVGVRSGTAISLYLDRNRIAIGTLSGSVSNAVALTFGDDNLGSRNFNGTIDEVRMYNRALATTDIESLYTQGGGTKVNTAVSQPQGTGRLDSGLAGYWKLDENTGTSAADSSTNANTGTLAGSPAWGAGQIGSAVDFDGSNDGMSVTSPTALNIIPSAGDTVSIAFWYNSSVANGATATLYSRTNGGCEMLGLNIVGGVSTDSLRFYYRDTSCAGIDNYTGASGVSKNIWHHVVSTYNPTSGVLIVYLDGVQVTTTTNSASSSISYANTFYVGRNSGGQYYDGLVDEFRVYERILSADEVAQLYRLSAPTGTDTSLKGYWSFNGKDISGTTAYDRSGAGNTGTLTNGPAITEGKLGQALSFDGSNDYITVKTSSLISASSALTVSAWVKTSLTADNQNIYTENNVTNGYLVHQVSILNTGKVVYDTYTPSGGGLNSATSVNDGVWHHITVTRAVDDTTSIYIDGTLDISGSVADYDAGFSVDNVSIGRRHNTVTPSQDDYFSGLMDEVRIYNRALSAGEVKGLYDVGQSDKVNSSASQPQGTGRLDSGLAGYWKLDDGSGTSATDASTNGNTGTLTNGPTWTTGQIGSAVNFDGTNDYVNAGSPAVLDDMGPITVSGWINADTMGSTRIINKSGAGFTSGWIFRLCNSDGANCPSTGNTLNFAAGFSGLAGRWYAPANSINTGQWIFVVVSYDRSSLSNDPVFYINGVKVTTTEAATPSGTYLSDASASLHIGADSDGSSGLDGKIDEVRIYNRALSADEVAELYRLNTPTGTDTSLKGYWSFNGKDVSGTTAYDRSGAGNTGTLTNGPAITEGKLGQGLNFDGTDDYVTAGSASVIDNIQTLTVSAWIKTRTYSNLPNIFNKAGVGGGWQVNLCQNSIGVCANAGQTNAFHFVRACEGIGTVRTRSPENSISTNTWQHLAITNDNSAGANTTKFYVNGSLVATNASACVTPRDESSNSLLIGSANGGGQFDGLIDEARLYNRVLTESEIKSLYNSSR